MKQELLKEKNEISLLPIHIASKHSSIKVVEYILQISEDFGIDWKLISIAINKRSADFVKLLLSKERGRRIVYSKSQKALCEVFETFNQRFEKFMEILKHCNLHYYKKSKKVSPLHLAAALNHKEAIELIIKKSPEMINYCSKLYSNIISRLIFRNENIRGMFYPIDFAMIRGNEEAVKILLEKGAKMRLVGFAKDEVEAFDEELLARLCYEEVLKVLSYTSDANGYKAKLLDILSKEQMRNRILENFYRQDEGNWFHVLHSLVTKIGSDELKEHFRDFEEMTSLEEHYGVTWGRLNKEKCL